MATACVACPDGWAPLMPFLVPCPFTGLNEEAILCPRCQRRLKAARDPLGQLRRDVDRMERARASLAATRLRLIRADVLGAPVAPIPSGSDVGGVAPPAPPSSPAAARASA